MKITITCEEDVITASEQIIARKLAYENRFVNDDCYTVKQIAAPYHLKPGDLNSFLCDRHVQRKVGRSYVLEPKYRGKGYTADRRRYYFNADGQLHYKVEMLWTAKGREFDDVYMLLGDNPYKDEQLFRQYYVGITRAKKILVIVGTRKALSYAVHHVTVTKRNTMLAVRIRRVAMQKS